MQRVQALATAEMKVVGVSVRTGPKTYHSDIGQLWQRFFTECQPDPNKSTYCVYTDYESGCAGSCTCICSRTTSAG